MLHIIDYMYLGNISFKSFWTKFWKEWQEFKAMNGYRYQDIMLNELLHGQKIFAGDSYVKSVTSITLLLHIKAPSKHNAYVFFWILWSIEFQFIFTTWSQLNNWRKYENKYLCFWILCQISYLWISFHKMIDSI